MTPCPVDSMPTNRLDSVNQRWALCLIRARTDAKNPASH